MNQTKPKTVEEVLKQFDEEFGQEPKYCCCSREYCYPGVQTSEIIEPIKSFIRSEITTLLESLKTTDWVGYGDGREFTRGYNERNREVENDINKILGKEAIG